MKNVTEAATQVMNQPHLCPSCEADIALYFCVGCRTTVCAAEAAKHYEKGVEK
jgi:hypothetical protein